MIKIASLSFVLVSIVACASSAPPQALGAEVPRDSADCGFVTGDKCFKTAKDACAQAGCTEDKCLQAESHPVQISCKK